MKQSIIYRTFDFNDVQSTGLYMYGCETKAVSYGNVEVVGYTEKRALEDGYDASDVFLGRRVITLQGSLHGYSRGDLYDRLRDMRYAINPRVAFNEDPDAQGYVPLYFSEPTERSADWPNGIDLLMRCRATGGVRTTFDRDRSGGLEQEPLSTTFEVSFEAKDPRIYSATRQEFFIAGTGGTLTLPNRGGHPARLNLILVLQASNNIRVFSLAMPDQSFDLTIPVAQNPITVRLDSDKKVVTVEDSGVEVLAMDYLDPPIKNWPELAPASDTTVTWSIHRPDLTPSTTMSDTSVFWYREAFS